MQPSGSLKGDSFLSLIFEIIGTHIQTKKKKAMSYGKKSRRIGKKKRSVEIWAMAAATAPWPERAGTGRAS
jgi:hypothetical protein